MVDSPPGFSALGGYVAAVMATHYVPAGRGLYPLWLVLLEMLIAGVASGVFAAIVGVPALRLRGIFLAFATIAFVEILRVIALNLQITGGAVGLAPLIVRAIFEIIRDLHASGVTILLVEQNATLALQTADRGYVLEAGRLTMAGNAADLLGDSRVRQAYLG